MNRWIVLIAFIALTVFGGLGIGYLTAPGAWYSGLMKPWFNPPNWLFGPVWTVLYVLIAVSGWRTYYRDRVGRRMRLWWAQLGLNFTWSPVFFAAQHIGLALVIVLLLLAITLVFLRMSWRDDPVAAWLFAPYCAWVAFATILNCAIWILN